MTRKIVILTEIIAPYRIPVFNALARWGEVDLHVIFLAETDPALRQWRVYTEEIDFSYQVLPSWRWRAGDHNLLINRGLSSALDSAAPQAIICGGYYLPAFWQALWLARRRNQRFILWTESNELDKRPGHAGVEWLKRRFIKSCSAFVVPGQSASRYVVTFGIDERLIFKAPNAVDNVLFAAHAENARFHAVEIRERLNLPQRFILFAGRLVREKGVFDLLEAYARLESDLRSTVSLVFAGEGKSRQELEQRALRINLGTVRFNGFLQREDLVALYALAEAVVLPTHSDTWGLAVNEAMACGLPVIVTAVAGCSADLVEDGQNGYVVAAGDDEQLRRAITSLLRDPGLRLKMGANSLRRIQLFSPEACAAGLAAAATFTDTGGR